MKCPFCNEKIELEKPKTKEQEKKDELSKAVTKLMATNEDEVQFINKLKNAYCKCGAHITLIKEKGEWKIVSASG